MPETVYDRGDLRRYRTEIPNIVIRGEAYAALSVGARWLYVYLKSVAGEDGACWQGTRKLSSGSGLSAGKVSSAKRELQEAGLIEIEPGEGDASDRIHIADVWAANMAAFSPAPKGGVQEVNGGGVQEVNGTVHQVNATVQEVNERSNPLRAEPIEEDESLIPSASRREDAGGDEGYTEAEELPAGSLFPEDDQPPPAGKAKPQKGGAAFALDSQPYQAAAFLFTQLRARAVPHVLRQEEAGKREATLQEWADVLDKLNRLDKLPWADIGLILRWLLEVDDFWIPRGNFQTAKKLRDKDRSGVPRYQGWLTAARTHYSRNGNGNGSAGPNPPAGYSPGGPDTSGLDSLRERLSRKSGG